MAEQQKPEPPVVHNNGTPRPQECPNHTHRRPIHPRTLTRYIYVREQRERAHADHGLLEAGCLLCFPPETGTR